MAEEHRFSSAVAIDPRLLASTPFKEKGKRIAEFDSGEPELDESLTTEKGVSERSLPALGCHAHPEGVRSSRGGGRMGSSTRFPP
jgi:hypothetical protein